MDPRSREVSNLVNGFEYYDDSILPISDEYSDLGFNIHSTGDFDQIPYVSPDLYPVNPDPSVNNLAASENLVSDDNISSDDLLSFISQMLMEENMETQPFMIYDPLALQQTEEILYQVISEPQTQTNSPHDSVVRQGCCDYGSNSISTTWTSTSTDTGTSTSDCTDAANFVNSQSVGDNLSDSNIQSNLQGHGSDGLPGANDGLTGFSVNELVIQKMFGDTDSVLQFKRGLEEASKFLPSSNQLIINSETDNLSTREWKEVSKTVLVKDERDSLRGRKNHRREETDFEEVRSSKQLATNVEDCELTEMFDKVLLVDGKCKPGGHPVEETDGLGVRKAHGRKKGKKKETVDFRSLLILCAQAVSANDQRTAHELLKQIREQSSPLGDGSQRVAHYFANCLEARLSGSSSTQNFFHALTSKKTTAADILKAYKVYLSASPFKTFTHFFSNKKILDVAEKASILHIIDFGILHGFQWPMLIQCISKREGGPPKLRITGIEYPQRGFRPTERIKDTGRRLAKYCERFGVPFEYHPIASLNWETINIDDLKIRRNEVLAVNCMHRFENVLDETAGENCPRDSILKLIREMNPDVFIHSIVNGSFNAPFFATRFKEALFYFSALFDVFDNTLPREGPERLMFEREFYGREVMNVLACEGLERTARPETYKQWQLRHKRAGFRQLRVDQELVEKLRCKLKLWYHKDFVFDEDSNWFLQGWKGRILYASSCWVPA